MKIFLKEGDVSILKPPFFYTDDLWDRFSMTREVLRASVSTRLSRETSVLLMHLVQAQRLCRSSKRIVRLFFLNIVTIVTGLNRVDRVGVLRWTQSGSYRPRGGHTQEAAQEAEKLEWWDASLANWSTSVATAGDFDFCFPTKIIILVGTALFQIVLQTFFSRRESSFEGLVLGSR